VNTLRAARIRSVIGAVARQALRDAGCSEIALLDDQGPEARLAFDWLATELGQGAVHPIRIDPDVEPLLQQLGASSGDPTRHRETRLEVQRMFARLRPDSLVANPVNKTAILLGGELPPDAFLPFGDLYASEIEEFAGGFTLPPSVAAVAEACGSVHRLDAVLRDRFDRRDPSAFERVAPEVRDMLVGALERGISSRRSARTVPKLGPRTIGVDLAE
jgi:hypothetical protein